MSTLRPYYASQGLDITSSDYSRPEDFHSGAENITYEGAADDPVIESRKGHQVKGDTQGGFGLIDFVRLNPVTDLEEKQVLSIGADLLKRSTSSLLVSYAGAGTTCTMSLKYNTSAAQMQVVLTVDGAAVLTYNAGKGFDEASPKTIAQLATAINAVADFTATASGTTTIPAAFLDVTVSHNLKTASLTLYAYEWAAVEFPFYSQNSGTMGDSAKPFFDTLSFCQDQENFENPVPVALNNVLYIPSGIDGYLMKYDGQKIYRAGMGKPTAPSLSGAVAGVLPAGAYQYRLRYVHVDAVGNRITGPLSDPASITLAASRQTLITMNSLIDTTYNVAYAKVNGAQTSATITVDSGHLLKAGDRAYLLNSSTYQVSEVLSVTATTVTLVASVTVADNAIITANLRAEIYRLDPDATIWKLVAEVPSTPLSSSTYSDNTASPTEELTEPEYEFEAPPPCKYVAEFKGSLVVSGIPSDKYNRDGSYTYGSLATGNDVWMGDYENIEGFPNDGSFTVSVASDIGDKITGMRETGNSFIVTKERSIARLTGDQSSLAIEIEWLSKEVGCLSHGSIQEVNGQLIFLSNRGVESLFESQPPDQKTGYRIQSMIKNQGLTAYTRLNFKRAVGHVFLPKQLYILYCPAEGGTSTETFYHEPENLGGDGTYATPATVTKLYSNSSSRVFVFDYMRAKWYEWRDLNMAGGICTHEDELWFAERRYSSYDSAVKYRAMRRLNNFDGSDYEDHCDAITWRLKTAWYANGAPKVPKQFLRVAFGVIPRIPNNSCTLTVKQETNYLSDTTKAQTTVSLAADSSLQYSQPQTRLADGKFKSMRLVFENSEHVTTPELEGWELEIDSPYVEELKK
jgi:hypothetical protein